MSCIWKYKTNHCKSLTIC